MPMLSLSSYVALIIIAGSGAEVETLKGNLARAMEQARVRQAAADNTTTDLKDEQAAHRRYEERVTKVEQALKDAAASTSP